MGTTFATGLTTPRGLAFDGSGNLFVAECADCDPTNGEILEFALAEARRPFLPPSLVARNFSPSGRRDNRAWSCAALLIAKHVVERPCNPRRAYVMNDGENAERYEDFPCTCVTDGVCGTGVVIRRIAAAARMYKMALFAYRLQWAR